MYYWVPLLIAASLLLAHEFLLRKNWFVALADGIRCRCGGRRLDQTPAETPKECCCRGADGQCEDK
jgi:hypothetical protein